MPIPEAQLVTWSNQGAVVGSASTHRSLKTALERYIWPRMMTYHTYLQGSYANATNIRGNSDVDLVVQSDAVEYSNLTPEEKRARNIQQGAFTFSDFKTEIYGALVEYYGPQGVELGGKSFKLEAHGARLAADVIPAIRYKEYKNGTPYGDGMTFWTLDRIQVKNFPHLHLKNGAAKNASGRANGWYKPVVRMLKNARERIADGDDAIRAQVPSYFLECLAYNASDARFGGSFQRSYEGVVAELLDRVRSAPSSLVCQNERQYLFGNDQTQWNAGAAELLLSALVSLWNNWYY